MIKKKRLYLSEEIHVRIPLVVLKKVDGAIKRHPELHLDRSDFIRGSVVRRLIELKMWGGLK